MLPLYAPGPSTATMSRDIRNRAYGQGATLSSVDSIGIWLSTRRIRATAGSITGKRLADVGCGYHAFIARSLLADAASMVLVDVAINPLVTRTPKVRALEGGIPGILRDIPSASIDVAICNSVLEHLWEPLEAVREIWRMLAPGGIALINVPSWKGKRYLEFSAFRLRMSPADEMQDHKAYYDPRDLWPLLVRAGFKPRDIRCFRHKFGLNTFAACHKATAEAAA